jgi:hypothetical protein
VALLNKAAIKAANDVRFEDVEVPEWDGEVRVRALTGRERDAYEASGVVSGPNGSLQRRMPADIRSRLLVMCLVDEAGERLFSDTEIKDLAAKDGAVIDRLFDVATRISGLGKKGVEAKKGNSESGQSDSST